MEAPVLASSLTSIAAIISYAKKTVYSYKCDWKGCDARLNCWESLQKHYHLHCRRSKNTHGNPTCYIQFCPLESHRVLSLQDLIAHVDKTHLSHVHIPCPLSDCGSPRPMEQFEKHFDTDHSEFFGMDSTLPALSPQMIPFQPASQPLPHPPLPQGTIPMHVILSSMLIIIPSQKSHLESVMIQEHLTPWSTFEFAELFDQHEEKCMIAQDLGFEPLRRPSPLSGLFSWPEFSTTAQQAIGKHATQVSQPFSLSALDTPEHVQTILYDAFERWLESGTQLS